MTRSSSKKRHGGKIFPKDLRLAGHKLGKPTPLFKSSLLPLAVFAVAVPTTAWGNSLTTCASGARVESTHPEVASEVTAFLSRSGIANNFAAAGCGIVLARVDRVGGGLQVRIKDASGRISQRGVSSVSARGALIESLSLIHI